MISKTLCISLVFIILLFGIIHFGPIYGKINTEMYSPDIRDVQIGDYGTQERVPQSPNKEIKVYVGILDLYGKINDALISYSTDKQKPWNNVTMRLINGLPSNGTYSVVIPAQRDNTTIAYRLYLRDDLNYSLNTETDLIKVKGYSIPHVTIGESNPSSRESATVYALVAHYDSDVKNVTLFYHRSDSKFVSVPMEKINFKSYGPFKMDYYILKSTNSTNFFNAYKAQIPSFPSNTNIEYFVKSYDLKGNTYVSQNESYSVSAPQHTPKLSADKLKSLNDVSLLIKFTNVDAKKQTAEAKIGINGGVINIASFDADVSKKIYLDSPAYAIAHAANIDTINNNIIIKDKSRIPLRVSDEGKFYSIQNNNTQYNNFTGLNTQYSLIGDTSEFPFDHYSLNIIFDLPFKNANINPIISADKLVNTSWTYSYKSSPFKMTDLPVNLGSKVPTEISANRNISFIKISSDFNRNYSSLAIVFPLLAIFYLLGSIFILDTTIDQLAIRLAITLGVFAFLFTFVPLVNETKPPTLNNVPTLAESLITFSLVGTIVFTISSVITGSLTLRNKPMRWRIWTDRIMFMIISSFIIGYLLLSHYPLNILIWIIPIIIVGLGYGLLLRISGLKIKISSKHSM